MAFIFAVRCSGVWLSTIKDPRCIIELWCWGRLLRVPWTARSNQSIQRQSVLNIHWKDWCWRWNSKTLATWCKELTHLKRPWCWERLKMGGKGDERGWDGWMASLTQWTWVWVNSGRVMNREAWRAAVHGVAKSWTQLSDWTELSSLKWYIQSLINKISPKYQNVAR